MGWLPVGLPCSKAASTKLWPTVAAGTPPHICAAPLLSQRAILALHNSDQYGLLLLCSTCLSLSNRSHANVPNPATPLAAISQRSTAP